MLTTEELIARLDDMAIVLRARDLCAEADLIANLNAEVIRLRAREAAGSVLLASVEDVTHGRGMFGINAGDDLDWAVSHLEAAITRYHALKGAAQ